MFALLRQRLPMIIRSSYYAASVKLTAGSAIRRPILRPHEGRHAFEFRHEADLVSILTWVRLLGRQVEKNDALKSQ